jgi:site-specific DNA-adenine methylase
MEELVKFILDKYNMYNMEAPNLINTNLGIDIHNEIKDMKNTKINTVLNYSGNKKNILQKFGNTFDIKNKEYFIDAFCGSLASSLYARNINSNIKVVAFDSNYYLINFYEMLRDNYDELINKIKHVINIIDKKQSIEDKIKHIRNNYIFYINKFIELNNKEIKLFCAAIYYLLSKIFFTLNTQKKEH